MTAPRNGSRTPGENPEHGKPIRGTPEGTEGTQFEEIRRNFEQQQAARYAYAGPAEMPEDVTGSIYAPKDVEPPRTIYQLQAELTDDDLRPAPLASSAAETSTAMPTVEAASAPAIETPSPLDTSGDTATQGLATETLDAKAPQKLASYKETEARVNAMLVSIENERAAAAQAAAHTAETAAASTAAERQAGTSVDQVASAPAGAERAANTQAHSIPEETEYERKKREFSEKMARRHEKQIADVERADRIYKSIGRGVLKILRLSPEHKYARVKRRLKNQERDRDATAAYLKKLEGEIKGKQAGQPERAREAGLHRANRVGGISPQELIDRYNNEALSSDSEPSITAVQTERSTGLDEAPFPGPQAKPAAPRRTLAPSTENAPGPVAKKPPVRAFQAGQTRVERGLERQARREALQPTSPEADTRVATEAQLKQRYDADKSDISGQLLDGRLTQAEYNTAEANLTTRYRDDLGRLRNSTNGQTSAPTARAA